MRFWDSSAIVPLLVEESGTRTARDLFAADAEMVVWWATLVECMSSIARCEHDGTSPSATRVLAARWTEVSPSDAVRADARRLLRLHELRAADALQLAAARALCDGAPDGFPLVTNDRRLAAAATREGFDVIDPLGEPRSGV